MAGTYRPGLTLVRYDLGERESAAGIVAQDLHHARVIERFPISASRLKRSNSTGSDSISGCGILIATLVLNLLLRQFQEREG
jgi:hypothetical protein